MTNEALTVSCEPHADGWRCVVRIGDDADATEHDVLVDRETLGFLAPGAEPDDLVHESFRFLLEREPRTSIMHSFELPIIGRYFAEYEREIGRRMRGD
ncbi:MAG: hypothetical protein ACRDGV_12140 [Candidatus Limnocylindria bacterium]